MEALITFNLRVPTGKEAIRQGLIALNWTVYLRALCIGQFGKRHIKSVEIAPQDIYLAEQPTDPIGAHQKAPIDECNPIHLMGSGWIAIPSAVSLDKEQAARVFDAVASGICGRPRDL